MATDEIKDEIKNIVSECVDYLYGLDFSPPGLRYVNELPSEEFVGKLAKKHGIDRFYAARLFNPVYQIFLRNFGASNPYPYNPFPFIENRPETHVHYWLLKRPLYKKKEDKEEEKKEKEGKKTKFVKMVLDDYTPYLESNLELARNGNNHNNQKKAVA